MFDVLASRDYQHPNRVGDLATPEYMRRLAQVAQSGVGAAANEHHVYWLAQQGLAGLDLHVVQRFFETWLCHLGRHGAINGNDHARIGAEGDHGRQIAHVQV